eukprot:s5529_g2.t1
MTCRGPTVFETSGQHRTHSISQRSFWQVAWCFGGFVQLLRTGLKRVGSKIANQRNHKFDHGGWKPASHTFLGANPFDPLDIQTKQQNSL